MDLKHVDSRSWDFSDSIIAWANFYNKSPKCICINATGSVSLENPDYIKSMQAFHTHRIPQRDCSSHRYNEVTQEKRQKPNVNQGEEK